ncbi:MAG: hypothetical protein IJI14_20035, partial [Anaerolineaceae bacterium]|nr:hypothetical protein [Anaerolineaceae bacterium]
MKEKNCFIDIHMLHTLAPTEIPVENSSSLQTIDFGKSRRASVSSESLTRGLNREFNESYIYD